MDREISVFDVANTFLSFESMTHKKLQKLCYYAQAWHLALEGDPLLKEEFQAWIHGPVCPELYDEYKAYGWQDIETTDAPENIINNNVIFDFLKQIYYIYGDLNGNELEMLTHMEEPWKIARQDLEPWEASRNPIDLNAMRAYYLKEFQRSQND